MLGIQKEALMYIWKIDKLKEQLITNELSESEIFKYMMGNTILCSLAMIQYSNPNQYDTIGGFMALAIGVFGLWFIYKCNGGKQGNHIIERYASVGLVILFRFFVFLMVPAVIALLVLQEVFLGGMPEQTTIIDLVFQLILETVYILWVAKHINDVAKVNA